MSLAKLLRTAITVFLLLAASLPAAAQSDATVKNIVLVHGAATDGSGWRGVYDLLVADGFQVSVVQQPLTGLAEDVAATLRVIDAQDGPVVLVGHSYGGSVITVAGMHKKVRALAYIAALQPRCGRKHQPAYLQDSR